MKTYLLIYIIIIICQIRVFAQNIPNGNFEKWITGNTATLEPLNWETQNEQGLFYVERAVGHKSSYSAKLNVVWDNVIKTFTGAALTTEENFSVNFRFDTLTGFFKGNINDTDTLKINVRMYIKGKIIGFGTFFTNSYTDKWTQFKIKINYNSDQIPDKADISIVITPCNKGRYQTFFYIDDMLLTNIAKYIYRNNNNIAINSIDLLFNRNKT